MADTDTLRGRPGTAAGGPRSRPAVRRAGAVTVTLLLLGTLGWLAVTGWSATTAELDRSRVERQGAAYLRPAVELLGVLGTARVAGIAGLPVDEGAVRAAVAAVEAVDARYGDALGVRQRWQELARAVLDGRLGRTGPAAFSTGGDLTDQVLGLLTAVDRATSLSSDPDGTTRRLAGAVTDPLPALVAEAGRLAAADALPAGLAGRADVRVTAGDRVTRAGADLDGALRAVLSTAPARDVDIRLVEDLRIAVADFAPPAVGAGAAAGRPSDVSTRALGRLQAAAARLALEFSARIDSTLAARESRLIRDRWVRVAVSVAALLLAVGVLWVRMPAPARAARPEDLGPVLRGPREDEAWVGSARLVDARALLRDTEIVHVGRAVRPAPRREAEPDDGAT